MNVIKTRIEGVLILEPEVFADKRGYFFESWKRSEMQALGIDSDFIQDNESKSSFGVLRGLHWQAAPYTQAKLLRAISGAILDVAVDIRRGSPTFGQHVAVELSGDNKRQLFIPRGFAHGFAVLSDEAICAYKCDNIYKPSSERGIRFDDPALGIDWRVKPDSWNLSEKDTRLPSLTEIEPWDETQQ